MSKLKVMTVVGTRPEIIRLSRVIAKLDESPVIDHHLVHTGQNYDYELNEIFFQEMAIRKPDHFLDAAGKTSAETVGKILISIDQYIAAVRPEAFLVLGDTNSCLCAIVAKKRKIPIFHMEAGNRCFDLRVPEETNRKIVDHISDINLPYSDIAREYLLREGIPADRVIKTGSPMYEVLNHHRKEIDASNVHKRLALEKRKYFVVSAHREENVSDARNFGDLIESLNSIAAEYGFPVIVSTHPRTRKVIEENNSSIRPEVRLLKPLGFHDYNALQMGARAVLSDSGTISEESSILDFPALNIRQSHERPEAMEEAAVMMVGLRPLEILRGLLELEYEDTSNIKRVHVRDYQVPNVSDKVVRIILSYVNYVKRVNWNE